MPNYYRLPFYVLIGLWQTGQIDAFGIAQFATDNPQLTNGALQYVAFLASRANSPEFDTSLLIKTPFINFGTIAQFITTGDPAEITKRAAIALFPFITPGALTETTPAINLGAAGLIVLVCQYMSKANAGQMFIFPYYNKYSLRKNERLVTMVIGNIVTIVVVRFLKRCIKSYIKSLKFGWNIRSKARIKISKFILER